MQKIRLFHHFILEIIPIPKDCLDGLTVLHKTLLATTRFQLSIKTPGMKSILIVNFENVSNLSILFLLLF